jgi:hypothetical protein
MTPALDKLVPRTGVESWKSEKSELYRKATSERERWGRDDSTSPISPYPWSHLVKQLTQEVLSPYKAWIDGVFARPEGKAVSIYVLTNNREHNHDLALALGLLEVKVDRELSKHYEEARVYPTPSWCLTESEHRAISRGALALF